MPGNVSNAAATTVLPHALAMAFTRSSAWLTDVNEYRGDGGSQRRRRVEASRKSWAMTRRLAPAAMTTLREFWEARNGDLEAFLFYDVYERAEEGLGWSYDETGEAEGPGKYVVRFAMGGSWRQEMELGRGTVQIALEEVA